MEDIKKIVIAKYIANIGSDKLPQTNIFTTKQFEESFNPIKDPIKRVFRNTRGEIIW